MGDVFFADVKVGVQGQGDDAPVGVPGDGGKGDPDVAEEVGRAGGAWGRVVVDAGALDVGVGVSSMAKRAGPSGSATHATCRVRNEARISERRPRTRRKW